MNKIIKQAIVAVLVGAVLCGPAMAAPRAHGGRAPAPQHQRAKAPRPAPRPVQHHGRVVHHPAPHHPAPPPPPRPIVINHHETATGWTVLGAAILGGIVGALAN